MWGRGRCRRLRPTGDRVHVRRDAAGQRQLYCMGRLDNVFKWHGKRFSLEEVESALRRALGPTSPPCAYDGAYARVPNRLIA